MVREVCCVFLYFVQLHVKWRGAKWFSHSISILINSLFSFRDLPIPSLLPPRVVPPPLSTLFNYTYLTWWVVVKAKEKHYEWSSYWIDHGVKLFPVCFKQSSNYLSPKMFTSILYLQIAQNIFWQSECLSDVL